MTRGIKYPPVTRFAWLSIAAALLTIVIKGAAYLLTNSVGLLSDALESFINLAGAVMALAMLIIALRPADDDHAYGHNKAEYFSSATEGLLIIIAAVFIIVSSIKRFINPQPLEHISLGLIISLSASLINLTVAIIISRAAKHYNSITLESDAKHLMTDVLTSAGVLIGVGAVAVTGWIRLDPIIGFIVACNILWAAVSILRKSVSGLMDKALSKEEQAIIRKILKSYSRSGISFHAILTRRSGSRQFVSFHALVPGSWSVHQGHELMEQIEADLKKAMPDIVVTTHMEPLEDPVSYTDLSLDRSY